MSLEATHIRFALELKDKYKIQDMGKYISGTIYPDSRYITKIERKLTHNDDILNPSFAIDDFRKGWQAHQICDSIQNYERKKMFPELFLKECDGWTEDFHVIATAIKIIQDMDDMQHFPIQDYLGYFEYAYNPNGEKIEEIKKYNQIMQNLYKDKKKTTVEDNHRMWLSLGIGETLGIKIKNKTEEFLKEKRLVSKISKVFDGMVKDFKEVIK
jgi:hypothetical protein